jgi:heme/copper-type cytochrome/quinol oxidase subunit 3
MCWEVVKLEVTDGDLFLFTEQQDSLPSDTQTKQETAQAQVHHVTTTLNVLKSGCSTVSAVHVNKGKKSTHCLLVVLSVGKIIGLKFVCMQISHLAKKPAVHNANTEDVQDLILYYRIQRELELCC